MGCYRLRWDLFNVLELAIGLYALVALGQAIATPGIWITPFLFIYACGFLYVSLKGIWESLQWARWRPGSKRQHTLGGIPYGN